MKQEIIKHKKAIIIFVIIGIAFIPLLIHSLFKLPAPLPFFEAKWTPGELLGFYGTLLGAGLAVIGVFLSIQYAQRNYQDDIKNRVIPLIAITTLEKRSRFSLFPIEKDNDSDTESTEFRGYEEYRLKNIYFTINRGTIEVRPSLTKEQSELLKQGGTKWVTTSKGRSLVSCDLVSTPCEIENVGNGAAINCRIGLNRKDSEHKYLPPRTIKAGEIIYIHIFCDNYLACGENLGQYELEFYYEDIYRTGYMQQFDFSIEINKEKNQIAGVFTLACEQKEI